MPVKNELLRASSHDETLEDPPLVDDIGVNTDKLSEISENDGMLYSSHKATTWIQRLAPLMRNPCVRAFTIINIFLLVLNFIIFVLVLSVVVCTIYHKISNMAMLSVDQPCLYHWSSWSECSADCNDGKGEPPYMTRHVIPETIVKPRGKYRTSMPCPTDIETKIDRAPCNTHRCAKLLSEMDFIGPFILNHNITKRVRMWCYVIRNVTRGDYLVKIDTTELTREANCGFEFK